MNLLLVIFRADPARGGAERYTIDLADALVKRGHRVSIASSEFAQLPDAVTAVPLECRSLTRTGTYRRFLEAVDSHLRENGSYDVVHAMLPVNRCDVYHPHAGIAVEAIESGHLKYDAGIGQTFSRVSNALSRKRRSFADVEGKLLTNAEAPVVLCLSEHIKRVVRKHYPNLAESKLATLFNATDLVKFDPFSRADAGVAVRQKHGIAQNDIVALMIAQDFQRKGLREAILATKRVGDPRLKLLVVGKEDPGRYRELASREGIVDRVIFAGSTKDPYAYYRAADFFVLPTRHDPCSLVVLEALAMGVPVISTTQNGACEIMSDGTHGFVLRDPADVPALSSAMRESLDAQARKRMKDACLALRPRLAYERHLQTLEAIYETIRRSSFRASGNY